MPTALTSRVSRITTSVLDGSFGSDKHKRLVVTLIPTPDCDLIELRPAGTDRAETLTLAECYRIAVTRRAISERPRKGKA